MRLRLTASAKLNLYLCLTGRRPQDGYHLLDSLVLFTAFGDTLEAEAANTLSLRLSGPFAGAVDAQDNLVLRAAQCLRARYGLTYGAALRLDKHIPVGAGLGGGSADAAATLHLLNALWDIGAGADELAALALPLGADVPACLLAQPLHMSGIGEVITPMPDFRLNRAIVLVNPGEPLLTAAVYREYARRGTYSAPVEASRRGDYAARRNDMQEAAIALCPPVRDVLDLLAAQAGCELARLCGSGATCFGLFADAAAAGRAGEAIRSAQPGWWVQVTTQAARRCFPPHAASCVMPGMASA